MIEAYKIVHGEEEAFNSARLGDPMKHHQLLFDWESSHNMTNISQDGWEGFPEI